ncbi:hypothetical protein PC128_g9195 [Phytophthora cactorum]|nr:hypothetical protein PC128_g9195 [Phytophthora cactorum]KAG4040953.1 hypothetical protein PC123_g23516 [Phytophthora cactorum]
MKEADEAMVPHTPSRMPVAVYPPLPPYTDHDLRLEKTTPRTAVIQSGDMRTSRQVEALAHHSAAVQQRTAEQLGQVQRQQDRLAAKTSEYLQAQHDRQSALLEQQQEMKRQMDEHRHYLEEWYRLLRAAEEAVGLQGQRLESLAEAVQPHLQGTMVRICQFELFKEEKDVTETEWRDYFLSARIPDNTAYKTLDREVKNLCMDTGLRDAESRLSRLMADFYEIADRLNIEHMVQAEPKKVVGYLVEALRPPAFKASVRDQLGRQSHKTTKSNIKLFLKWSVES